MRTLHPGVSVATSASGGTAGVTGTTEVRVDPRSANTGIGYDVRMDAGHGHDAEAIVTDHTPFADIESDAVMAPSGFGETLTFSGGIAAVARHAFVTRPIENGFALVDTGGISGLPMLIDNHPAGYTDRSGYLLVNALNPNAANRIAVDSTNVPLNVELKHSAQVVSPSYRGGAVVRIEAKRLSFYTGTLLVRSGGHDVVPADGRLVLSRGNVSNTSELDDGGGFYLENVPPGRYAAAVAYPNGACSFDITITATHKLSNALGTLTCIGA